MDMDKLRIRADTAIAAYRDEIEKWSLISSIMIQSRERLTSFIDLKAPEWIIRSEIDLLMKRVLHLKQNRLKTLLH